MDHVSTRLREALFAYGLEGDLTGIDKLGQVVANGGKPWLPAEFEKTLRAGLFTPRWWGAELYNDDWTDEEAPELDRDLRAVWAAVAPDRPFPLDEATGGCGATDRDAADDGSASDGA